jgi:putative GTP pyrophosphokinase
MKKPDKKNNPKEFYTDRAIRCFAKYVDEYNYIRQLLEVRLNQIAALYTMQNNLPRESIKVLTRVKSLQSFLKKLEKNNWKDYYMPSEIAEDLIGGRIVCWFLDDCYGIEQLIKSSKQLHFRDNSYIDYIKTPKSSGYRSIHFNADITYDRVKRENDKPYFGDDKMICEIQIRTKIQDVFGDLTHEFHYKEGKDLSDKIKGLEKILALQAKRLESEDESFIQIRDLFQQNKSSGKERKNR